MKDGKYDLVLEAFPAAKGDSFLLSWGKEENFNHLLIDSGIPNTYRFIKGTLKDVNELSAIILTHVDYDHLGGMLKMFDDSSITLRKDMPVYMNTPSLVLTLPEGDKVGLRHGIELDIKLQRVGISCQPFYNGFTEDNILEIDGLTLLAITPDKTVIDKLLAEWTADKLFQKYQEEAQDSGKVGKRKEKPASFEDILKAKETIHKWEDDLINSSSISFVASFNGCAILFLGDANPDLIVEELKRIGYSKEHKLNVHLVKISHHGCKHNSGKELFELIDCNCYLISTDGSGPYNHPDRETIARLSEYSRVSVEEPLTIYLNYNLDTSGFTTKEEAEELNISFIFQNKFKFSDCKCFQKK
ncbi:MBL fold metallo-hydrolase [Sphingobacterium sp. IITKGP-BTPF85]|uniref:MBL fold metallo-hydrolase n=1 Tax=Sphingobacterium sp. IITKGP-BTPF85 TaxID=1338009 RepID=UPI00038A106C|nr:MBL fold metallo-hydrolase [Sphingobacterium sp. IITKGP-BTPF85]KKX47711.1 hypothetical protein L950_0225005 [Sphingobacterium sp. IITKGP-BTPF85]